MRRSHEAQAPLHLLLLLMPATKNWLATAMLAPVKEIATPFDLTSMKDFMGCSRTHHLQTSKTMFISLNYHMHINEAFTKS